MKKIILILVFVLTSVISLNAQNSGENVYCEIVGTEVLFSKKVTVDIDFGQKSSFWSEYKDKRLVDENGKAIKFNSMVDALNFMAKLGWEFQQAYVVTTNEQSVCHWLMKKTLKEGESIKKGIKTQKDLN